MNQQRLNPFEIGNRQMRRGARKRWNEEDATAARKALDELVAMRQLRCRGPKPKGRR